MPVRHHVVLYVVDYNSKFTGVFNISTCTLYDDEYMTE